jgi:hypothetical protein
MNTTLIFAELFIIGLEGGIWLSFLVLSVLGLKDFDSFLLDVKDWQVAIATIAIPLLYVFGIILDRLIDRLFKPLEQKIDRQVLGDLPVTVPVMRYSLGVQNDFLNQQLEYTRTRMRIARASTVNFMLISLTFTILLFTRVTDIPLESRWNYAAFIIILGILLSYAAFITWRLLVKGHLELNKTMYEYQNKQNNKKSK